MDENELTYADAGVDIEASEAATSALLGATKLANSAAYAGLVDLGDRYLALATDGVGTKLLVAEALGDYSTVGIDCIAMNVNDLVAAGVDPVAFVDYLAIDEPDETITAALGEGLATGANRADIALVGGETAVMPEVVSGLDLAGACAGIAEKGAIFEGEARSGDALVGWPSSGIHSNGLTLARKVITRSFEYSDPLPGAATSIGRALLEPTRIYTPLLGPMRTHDVQAAAHVTGGGWTNLGRMGDFRFEIDDLPPSQPIFEFVQEAGNVSDLEMYRTFNMGTGFVAAVGDDRAPSLADKTGGRVIGEVSEGTGIGIRGLELEA